MTAYEFCQSKCLVDDYGKADKNIEEALIEFAKYHVKQALIAADLNALVEIIDYDGHFPQYGVDSKSILEAYPESNIK